MQSRNNVLQGLYSSTCCRSGHRWISDQPELVIIFLTVPPLFDLMVTFWVSVGFSKQLHCLNLHSTAIRSNYLFISKVPIYEKLYSDENQLKPSFLLGLKSIYDNTEYGLKGEMSLRHEKLAQNTYNQYFLRLEVTLSTWPPEPKYCSSWAQFFMRNNNKS